MASNLWLDCFLKPPGSGGEGPGPDPGSRAGGGCTVNCNGGEDCGTHVYFYCDPAVGQFGLCKPWTLTWEEAGLPDSPGWPDQCRWNRVITINGITYFYFQKDCYNESFACTTPGGGGGGMVPGGGGGAGGGGGGTDQGPCEAFYCFDPDGAGIGNRCRPTLVNVFDPCYQMFFGDSTDCTSQGTTECGGKYLNRIDCYNACTEGPGTPGEGDKCWRCPAGSGKGKKLCCKKNCQRIKNLAGEWECPEGCTDGSKECNDKCVQSCVNCDEVTGECEKVKKVPCGTDCAGAGYFPNFQACEEECEAGPTDCYSCNPDTGCCVQDCERVSGDCPSNCYENASCKSQPNDPGCKKTCYKCTNLGDPCTTIEKDCNQVCNAGDDEYDTPQACEAACEGSLSCYRCVNPGPSTCCTIDPTCSGTYCQSSDGCYSIAEKNLCDILCKHSCPACDEEDTCNGSILTDCSSTCPTCVADACDGECTIICEKCTDCDDCGSDCRTNPFTGDCDTLTCPDGWAPSGTGCSLTGCPCTRTCWDCITEVGGATTCTEGDYPCESGSCVSQGVFDDKYCGDGCGPCEQDCYKCTEEKPSQCVFVSSIDCDVLCDGVPCTCSDTNIDWYEYPNCADDPVAPFGCQGGESNYFGETPVAVEMAYAPNIIDPIYERNVNNRKYYMNDTPFTGVRRQTMPSSLFAPVVHSSLEAVNLMNNSGMLFSDYPYTNLSNKHIEQSLTREFRALINQVKLATGESIKTQIIQTIRQLIISNRITSFDSDELLTYLRSIKAGQVNYPQTRGRGASQVRGSHRAEASAIRLASDTSWPIKFDEYPVLTSEKMKLWKTLATDLNKNIPIRLSNGSVSSLYYTDADTIPLGGNGLLHMSVGDVQKITNSSGDIIQMPVQGDFDRGRILQIEELQRIIYLLGQDYNFTLNVKTNEEWRLDERYGVEEARKDYYFLQLDPNTISPQDRDHSMVSVTEAKYLYMSSTSDINEWLKYRPWPFMIFYLEDSDPMFKYIDNVSGQGEVTLTTKDFTLDIFEDNPNTPIYLRRALQYIILIPSDMDSNVINHQISYQKSYGERELVLNVNPNPTKTKNLSLSSTLPHIKEVFTYPNPGVTTANSTVDSLYYEIDTSSLEAVPKYTSGAPILPYPSYGNKLVLSALQEFKENYNLDRNTVGWNQVYEVMDNRAKTKYLYNENFSWENTRSLLGLGKISSSEEVNSNYAIPKDVMSTNKKITDPTFGSDFKIVSKKYPVAPGPSPIE